MLDVKKLSPTMDGVVKELSESVSVAASDIVKAILSRHSEYGERQAHNIQIPWPENPREMHPEAWLKELAPLYKDDIFDEIHGKAVILGLALVDRLSGWPMVETGLFYAIAGEIEPTFLETLSEVGKERLRLIPLAQAAAGDGRHESFTHAPDVSAIALSRDGRHVASVGGKELIVWNLTSGSERNRIESADPIRAVAFNADGSSVVTVGGDGRVSRWPVSGSNTALAVFGQEMERPHQAVISTDGSRAVVTGGEVGGDIWIVDTVQGTVYSDGTVDQYEDMAFYGIAVAPDGSHVIGYTGLIYDYPAREMEGRLQTAEIANFFSDQGDRENTVIAVGPQGLFAVAHSEFPRLTLMRRQETDGQLNYVPEAEIKLPDLPSAGGLAFSPSGSLVATADKETCTLWNSSTGTLAARLPVGGKLAFSGDGRRLAIAGYDGRVEVWDVGLELPDAPAPVAGFIADQPDGPGYLDIDDDVDAFASVIAARSIEPPLSIGLFGVWGSGKTFFMRRLRDRVAEITRLARESGAMQKDITLYKRVAQIEFNAWHYSSGELWAGLVEHIFAKLELYPNEPLNAVEARRRPLLEKLGVVEAELEQVGTKVTEAQEQLDQAEAELTDLDQKHRDQLEELRKVTARDLWDAANIPKELIDASEQALKQAGHDDLADTGRELSRALTKARETLTRGSGIMNALTRAENRQRRFCLLVALILGSPVLGAVIALLIDQFAANDTVGIVSGMSTGLVTLLTTGARWIRTQARWVNERLDEIDKADKRLRAPYENAEAEQRQDRAQVEHQIEVLKADLIKADNHRANLQREVGDLEAEVQAATPENLLARFISDRADSDDYRRHLGLLTLVRRDFETISDFLEEENRTLEEFSTLADEEKDADQRINRIVLYIDDLDRCEPDTVVKVLQAIHLLLAFPLFVVVVGVDSRWVSESLMNQYPTLLEPGEPATSHDYLEKIFQVPFWLRPLSAETSAKMLRGLIGQDMTGATGSQDTTSGTSTGMPPRGTTSGAGGPDDAKNRTGTTSPVGTTQRQGASPDTVRRSPDLNPLGLVMTQTERDFIQELGPLLTRSPRALKRFVNVYRLIKVRRDDPTAFVREQEPATPFKIVMLLLAIVTGLPGISAWFFDLLRSNNALPTNLEKTLRRLKNDVTQREAEKSKSSEEITTDQEDPGGSDTAEPQLKKPNETLSENMEQITQFEAWLDESGRPDRHRWKTVPTETLAEWTEIVARYSFRVRV